MKISTLSILAALALGPTTFAEDTSVTLKHVHLCCDECVRGVGRSVKGIDGVTVTSDKDAETVVLTGSDKRALQKAADAMAAGGYFGVSEKPKFKPVAVNGTEGKMVHSMIVTGVHLCCGGCVDAVDRAIKQTPGATGHTAKKHSKTFVVSGNFNDQKFFEALQQEGLNGKVTTHAEPDPIEPPSKSKSDH